MKLIAFVSWLEPDLIKEQTTETKKKGSQQLAGISYEEGLLRRCTPKQLEAVKLYFEGKTQAEISKQVGVSQRTVASWLKHNPSVLAEIQRIKEETMGQLHTYLNRISIKAVQALEAVIDDPESKPGERIRASQTILEQMIRVDENVVQAAEFRVLKEKITAILSEFEASDSPEIQEFAAIRSLREGVLHNA